MTVIACLHGARSNIDLFEEALRALDYPDIQLLHRVESELFERALSEDGITPYILSATQQAISELCEQSDAVVVTCTTLGVAACGVQFSRPVYRIDAALAKLASHYHGTILVLCTASSTVEATKDLFSAYIPEDKLTVELIPRAWAWFNQGDMAQYHKMIADYLLQRPECTLGCIVLAQASMTGAARLFNSTLSVLTGPQAVLQAAIDGLS